MVLRLDFGGNDLDAVDDEVPKASLQDVLTNLPFELPPVTLELQHPLEQFTVEAAVALQLGHGANGAQQLRLGDAEAEAGGFVLDESVVDQRVERLAAEVDIRNGRPARELLHAPLQQLGFTRQVGRRD